jgi:hypothetical protein
MASTAYDLLTTDPDHEGITAHKPLMPSGDKYQVFLGDTKLEEPLVRSGKMWDASCRVIQSDVEKLHKQNPMVARKYLGFLERQHGDYSKFVPKRLTGLRSAKPETIVTDNFNRANGSLGAAWTVLQGTFSIISNQYHQTNDAVNGLARYETPLSAADHYAQAVLSTNTSETLGQGGIGGLARVSSSAATCYLGVYYRSLTVAYKWLAKFIAGTRTDFFLTLITPLAVPITSKINVSGSDLTLYHNGISVGTATDSAITGNLYTGIYGFESSAGIYGDDFQASDGISSFVPRMMLLGVG